MCFDAASPLRPAPKHTMSTKLASDGVYSKVYSKTGGVWVPDALIRFQKGTENKQLLLMVTCYITAYKMFYLPHKQSEERWLRTMAYDLQILSTTDKHLIL